MALIVRPFFGLICLIVVLYLFILTPIIVNGLTDGTCYSNETLEFFTFTPGQYEPEPDGNPIRPEKCSGLCADAEYPLAGVVSSVYCLCADETTIKTLESLAPLTPAECNSTSVDGNLRVYKGEILHAVSGLAMNITPNLVGYTQELVNFSVILKKGVDVQFSFDFGDDSARTDWNVSRKISHIYQGSGYFKVKLFARQPAKPERSVVITSKVIQIVDRLESVDIDFRCFSVIEPDEDSGCNITVLAGQDLNATIDFGDSTEPLEFTVPDTRFNPLGPLIVDSANMTYEEAAHGLYILSDSAKSYSSNSNIRALEGYSTQAGEIELIVYRPWCGNNTPCSLGVVSCSPPKVFCLRDKNCIDPGTKVIGGAETSKKKLTKDSLSHGPSSDSCRSHIDLFPEYKVARRVLITVTRNYFYYHLSKSRDFRIGDLIALKLFDAKLALISTESTSTSNLDLIHSSSSSTDREPPKIIGYESLKPMSGKKLLVRVITYENSEFYLPHPYADNGNYTVKLVLTSPWLESVKNFTYEAKIAVQTPIDQIRLRVVPPNAVVGQKVSSTIRINGGSDVKLTWDFGDNYKTSKKVDFVKSGQKFIESHEYTTPGVYRISVGASNLQNKYTTGQTITVQYPITSDWKLTSNSPQLLPGTIDLLLTYPLSSNTSEMILPTNGSVSILFGDGSTHDWTIPEKWSDLPNGEKIFSHRYKYPGNYKVIVTMSNLVSTLTLKTDIFLLRRITGFEVDTYSHGPDKQITASSSSPPSSDRGGKKFQDDEMVIMLTDELTLNKNHSRNKLPIGSQVKFTFNQTTGDVDKYIVYLNEKSIKETGENGFHFIGKKPGWHNFTFYAYNKIQGRSEPMTRNFYFMKPISGLGLTDISVDVTKPANKILQITLNEIGTDSCVAILYGDLMPFQKSASLFGQPEHCSEGFPEVEAIHYGEINETMVAPYDYTGGPGDYVVTVKAWNAITKTLSTQLTITVLEIDCYMPEVSIFNPIMNHTLGTKVWRSKPVQLYSLAKVDCNASITVIKYWECFSVDEFTGEVVTPYDLSMLDSYRKTVLYIPPFFLPQGLYEFRFVVNLTNLEPHPLLPFSNYAKTYIRVVRSPIIGKMTAGAESRAIRGMGQRLKLGPGLYSVDPDDETNKNFSIIWYCRRLPSERLFDSVNGKKKKDEITEEKKEKKISKSWDEDDDDNGTETEENDSKVSDQKSSKKSSGGEDELTISSPLWERPTYMEDLGGCFGKGPGQINITDREIDWPTSVFYAAGFVYEIVVKIVPPDREPSWSGIQLNLLDRSPPSITIQCQTPSLCYPNVPLGQKINPVRVGLIGVCDEDCGGTLIYEWTIFGIDTTSGEEHLLKDAADFVTGVRDVKMALGKEFFDRYYPLYGDFFAKLSVVNEKGDRGESDIFLHINKPPTGGDCNMTSTGQYALLDKHLINCYNWYDPEFKPIDYYGFWILNRAKDSISFLSYGPSRAATLILPPGDFQVGVDIRDREGALTRHPIANLTLIPPTQQQFDAFMEMRQLENADASGDQSRMSMISQAVSALMNIDLIDENLLETLTTSTTTTTTTVRPTVGNGTIFAQKSEAKIEEEVRTRSKMVQSVENIMNVDTLNSLEAIGSVLSAISGRGKGIDNEAKDVVIRLLNKTINMASNLDVESPQQLIDFCMFAVGTMGAIVNRMTEQLIKKVVLPTDRSKAWGIEYEVEPPDYGESKDYVFDGKSSVEESLARAVILNERKLGEEQIKQMVGLTIDLVLAILRNIVVGEKPLTFSAPSGLSFTIEMFNGGGLTNKSIKHGDAVYIFPEVCSILTSRETCYGNETMGIMAVSWPSILESFGNSVDLLSEDTQTLQLIVLDDNLRIIDVTNATDYFSIIIPRTASSTTTLSTSSPSSELNEIGDETLPGTLSTTSVSLPEGDFIIPKPLEGESMQYHQFLVTKAYSALKIEITPTNPVSRLILFLNYKSKPFLSHHEVSIPLEIVGNQKTHDIFLGNNIIANRTGFFYLGIVSANESALRDSSYSYLLDDMIINSHHLNPNYDNYSITIENVTRADWMLNPFGTNYTIRIYTSGCYFYDYNEKIWSGKGCHVATANSHMTHCKCNHLTSFGSGFFVMPNTIDFSYVFANAGFVDNITIYITVLITLMVYIILVIWARSADRDDLKKLGATPLPDNDPKDKYLYEMTVYTGDKEGSETDSKVSFILSGDDDETDVRNLSDPVRKIFRRGSQDIFVMAVPRKLGRLTYLRIWHDNSGSGKRRSWFLNFIVIRDVQTGEKFEFICNKWFAVEKGDGVIDRLIPVAGLGEATEFSHLFHNKTSKGLKDGHLWFSVFLRPTRSRFTRVQRVSCCMAMLYLSMLVNAMWYEKAPPKPRASALEFGPFTLSPEQIGIGFMANLIVFPPTFLIVLFFRKSRLRRLRPSRLEEAAKRQGIKYKKLTPESSPAPASSGSTVAPISTISDHRHSTVTSPSMISGVGGGVFGGGTGLDDSGFGVSATKGTPKVKRTIKRSKKQFLFPWWCRYIGWALCILCMVVSVFFLWAYGVQFGDKKTRKWLTSLVISFFASVLVTQPVKVFLTAMILSTLFKAPDADIDESEEDEEDIDLELRPDEEWLHDLASMSPNGRRRGGGGAGRRAKYYRPPNLTALERAKFERLKEIQMGIILKDIFSYLVFLWLLIVLSYGNRDPNAFLTKDFVKATFINGANTGVSFTSATTTASLWDWIEKTLIPELAIGPWYNNYQPYGLRGFLNDRVNRVMGYGVLRSTRIRESTCSIAVPMDRLLREKAKCREFGNIIFEDRKPYNKGWTPFNVSISGHKINPLTGNNHTHQMDYDDISADNDKGPDEEGILTKIPGEDIVLVNPSKSKKTPWQYRKPSELNGLPFWGILDVYSGGGYTVPLRGSKVQLLEKMSTLKKDYWIDERTRSVFTEFSAYNPQVNLFTVVTILAEFQPGGGIVPNYRIDVVRLIRYHQGFGLFVILCELAYVCFIIYFTVREVKKIKVEGLYYFTSYWNWAELFIIVMSYVAIGLYIYRTILTHTILKIFDRTHGNGYIKLQYVTFIDELFGYIMAFVIFIGILKFIRLLRFNKRMGLLYSTLAQCSKDLKSFCIVFLVVFFAFVQLFYLLFGTSIPDFSSFVNAAETSFGMVTGKFDFAAMVTAAPILGPISFFIFVLIAQIILVNVFLTLIISAFETVKHNISKQNNEFEMVNFILGKFKEILGIDGHGSVHPGNYEPSSQALSVHDQIKLLPEKVDSFLAYIDELFYSTKDSGSPLGGVPSPVVASNTLKGTSKLKYTDLMNIGSGLDGRSNLTGSTIRESSPNGNDNPYEGNTTNNNYSSATVITSGRPGGRAARRARRLSRTEMMGTPQHNASLRQSTGGAGGGGFGILDWAEIPNRNEHLRK